MKKLSNTVGKLKISVAYKKASICPVAFSRVFVRRSWGNYFQNISCRFCFSNFLCFQHLDGREKL